MQPLPTVKKSVLQSKADLVIITTNGTITTSNDRLVMNTGSAFEASRLYPWLPGVAAKVIVDCATGMLDKKWLYGFAVIDRPEAKIGLFQSKLDWNNPAIPAIIGFSAVQLALYLQSQPRIKKVALNMPGVGIIGGLSEEIVMPLLSCVLPRRVSVYIGPVLGE